MDVSISLNLSKNNICRFARKKVDKNLKSRPWNNGEKTI